MSLPRILEPEVMDSMEEALAYDAMDHTEVNRQFVEDFVEAGWQGDYVLDMGTGTALIPLELCQRNDDVRIVAIDMSASMLDVARNNLELAMMMDRVVLDRVDANQLPYEDGEFDAVMSNSIVHHLPEPRTGLVAALRVLRPGGLIFLRDLMRPHSETQVQELVDMYAASESAHARQMFADSLRAALSLAEIREIVASLGFDPQTVQATSDRHWTWRARKS